MNYFTLDDILSNVFQFCSASTIYCRISLVCTLWRNTVQSRSSAFWYEVYANQFPYCEHLASWEEWKRAEIVKDCQSRLWTCGCLERVGAKGHGAHGDYLPFRLHDHRLITDWKDALTVCFSVITSACLLYFIRLNLFLCLFS
jgi:hypothetical protein